MRSTHAGDRPGKRAPRGSVAAVLLLLLLAACGDSQVEPESALEPIGAARQSAIIDGRGPGIGSRASADSHTQPERGTEAATAPEEDEKIQAAIDLVAASPHTYVSPRDDEDPAVYSGPEFARMLERKWKWIGADLHQFDAWMTEIGDRSFRYDRGYRVRIEGQEERDFGPWLRAQMGARADPGG